MSKPDVAISIPHANTTPIPQLLDRAVREMRDLTSVVNELEALIGNLVIAGSFGSSNSIYDLQKLDRLRQNIGGIADFLDGIGRHSAPEWQVDADQASEFVTLADLSERLRGRPTEPASAGDADSGDFEMFGDDELSKVA